MDAAIDQHDIFKEKHIAGAIYLDLANLRDTTNPYPNMMPNKDQILSHLQNLGVGLDTPVVCYDVTDGRTAARANFVLTTWGFKNARILDGGLKAWGERACESGESNKGNDKDFNLTFDSTAVESFETIQAITSGQI